MSPNELKIQPLMSELSTIHKLPLTWNEYLDVREALKEAVLQLDINKEGYEE